ncbi:hypothetical protein GC175_01845 [bacterium]|nr:hypothetical protein [bacterium]
MPSTLPRSSGRVSIDADWHELYRQLSEGHDSTETPFRTMKDIFMISVCLGHQSGERLPLKGNKRQIFHYTQYSEQTDIPILKAIALSATEDISTMSDFDRVVEIAEEYANAGILRLQSVLRSRSGEYLWNLVGLVRLESND